MPETNGAEDAVVQQQIVGMVTLANEEWRGHREVHAMLAEQLQQTRKDLERRLDGMNGLHAQINQERGHFVTRELHEGLVAQLLTRHESVLNAQHSLEMEMRDCPKIAELENLKRVVWMGLGGVLVFGSLVQALLFVIHPWHM